MAISKKALQDKLAADREQQSQKTPEQKAIAAEKRKKTADTAPAISVPEKKLNKRITSKVFSFWGSRDSIAVWQAYQKANPDFPTVEALGTAALDEFIRNHPLAAEQKTAFDALLVLEQQKAAAERAEAEKKYS